MPQDTLVLKEVSSHGTGPVDTDGASPIGPGGAEPPVPRVLPERVRRRVDDVGDLRLHVSGNSAGADLPHGQRIPPPIAFLVQIRIEIIGIGTDIPSPTGSY